jgi:acyl-coenzyme A synthetase/AMP-(fatty) acid ligase
MNISDPIRRNARIQPQAQAILNFGNVFSYAQLDGAVDAVAARMLGLNLAPGRAAGVVLSSGFAQMIFTLALARIGAIAVTSRDVVLGVGGVTTDVVFTDAGAAAVPKGNAVLVDDGWFRPPAGARPVDMHPGGGAPFMIVSSSGTTGVPKAMALSHDLMRRRVESKWLANRAPDHARQICAVGLETYYGMSIVLRTLWTGGLVATAIRWEDIPAAIPLYQINYVAASPAQLGRMLESFGPGVGPFPTIQVVEVGGSTLPAPLAARAKAQLGGEIRVSYGATEHGFVASASVDAIAGKPGAVGHIGPGIEVQAVDDAHQPLPPGSAGRIRFRSPTLLEGYVGDPKASAEAFRDGWFYPGDIGSVGEDGVLTIAGRAGETVNAGGVKVSPRHIEDVVLQVDDVAEAAVFVKPNAAGVDEIWAAIVQKRPVDVASLLRHCTGRLGTSAPRMVLVVDKLPRNAAGKVVPEELLKIAAGAKRM